ncbi:hypothetical protein [Pararobbsia alpina]|uniref:Uncharacterized protein n=1 Tax=Pararobbsia alpina TaxID=621374 RepID=A0A6S7B6E9_9BURK|nr:hypothetical protein [Pararobbsia alpina]CAB3789416.1 hypothetical protein LMG28138_02765 [Pararobbsia alpina]
MFGLVILFFQLFVCLVLFAVGLWSVARPKHLQHFIHSNFALLPAVRKGVRITPIFIRLAGMYLLWFAYTLTISFHEEILWVERQFEIRPPGS